MCEECGWKAYLESIASDMLDDEDYAFARDTVEGIYEWVEENSHITDRQQDALENIRNSLDRRRS